MIDTNLKKILSVIILVSYMILIFYVSSLHGVETTPETRWNIRISQDIKHFAEFTVLGILMINFFIQDIPQPKILAITFATYFSIFYGVFDEVHQHFVPTRYCTIHDMTINMLGSISGISLYMIITWVICYNRQKQNI